MANDEHVALLRKGTAIWNEWRERNPGIRPDLEGADFYKANLSGAYLDKINLGGATLQGANLRMADLTEADLSVADLINAKLTNAILVDADLNGAVLYGTDLGGAELVGANLTNADLGRANLSGAIFYGTTLGNVDFTDALGLTECRHQGPSTIDLRTLSRSRSLPVSFLRGCGVPDILIEYLPSLVDDAILFYSCFISYSSKDEAFASQLYADLQDNGVRCWFATHDLPIGAKTSNAVDEAIRIREKLLVILSEASIASDWVEDEVSTAFAEERKRGQTVLFPIRIDDAVMTTPEPWARKVRDQRNIGDFRQWRKVAQYQKGLTRLLRDLKASSHK